MTIGFKRKKIKSHKSLGEKLSSLRIKMGYSLDYVEKQTKINLKYINFIEENNYNLLPADVYVVGFLKRYAEFLDLSGDEIVNQFRNEKELAESLGSFKKNKADFDIIKPNQKEDFIQTPRFVLTPKIFVSSLVIFCVLTVLSYIWYQVKGFAAAPPIQLDSVSAQQIVNVESISIAGQTDPGASLFINSQPVAIDQNGNFSQLVKLANGYNNIEIKATNKAEKETTKLIKIMAEY
jgi:cytoskeletal protein RodZ